MKKRAKELEGGSGFRVLFISSTMKYRMPEDRGVHLKKFEALLDVGDMNYLAVSEAGGSRCGYVEGAHLYLAPRTGFRPLDLLLFMGFALKKGLEVIRRKDIQIIYAQGPMLDGIVGCILKNITGRKLVVGLHGDWENEIRYSKPGMAKLLPVVNLIARSIFRNADAVRAISKATEERALEFVPKRKIFKELFPALFDIDFFLEGEVKEPREDSAVFVGSLIGRKGIEYLLKGLPEVVKEFPDFRLYLLGKGSNEGELKGLAKRLGVEKNVRFVGHQPAENVREYIDRSRVLVLPSLSEGLGRIALEAMARGRPVIGSQVEGIRETVKGERGYPVPPRDSKAITSALLEVMRDKKGTMKKGEMGRRYVEKEYSMNKYVKNYEALFRFILER